LECDRESAFGGVLLLNRKITIDLAKKISQSFFELIIAPEYDLKSLDILKLKKNLIILKNKNIKKNKKEFRSTIFGTLYQETDKTKIDKKFVRLVTNKKTTKSMLDDLIFSLKVSKHLKSNAIVLSRNKQTVGLSCGQTSRIEAVKLAIKKMNANFKINKVVCASDGFFPFTDSVQLLNKSNCKVIAQPAGSVNDRKVINYSIKNQLSLYFCKNRLFKH